MALFNITAGAKIDEAKYYAKMGGIGGGIAGLAAGTATGGIGKGLKWGFKGAVGGSAGGALSPTVQRVTAGEVPVINVIAAANINDRKIKMLARMNNKFIAEKQRAIKELSPSEQFLYRNKMLKTDDKRLAPNKVLFDRARKLANAYKFDK